MVDYLNREVRLFDEDERIGATDGAAKRNRFLKNSVYARLPLYLRAVLMYVYRYVFRLGFLDGRVGLVFHFMHGFWLFMLIDAKLDEARDLIQQERRRGFQAEPPRRLSNRLVMARSSSSSSRRPVVLVLLGCFWPGNDSSGPNQSFRALASALGDRFDFRLVARDRPTGPDQKAQAQTEEWTDLGFAQGALLRHRGARREGLRALIQQTPHDVLWLNSIFDREFSLPALAMRRLGLIDERPTLLSPRGEFGLGALSLKSRKKRVFLEAARRIRLWSGVTLHATSEAEASDMAAGLPGVSPIVVAPNIRLPLDPASFVAFQRRRFAR